MEEDDDDLTPTQFRGLPTKTMTARPIMILGTTTQGSNNHNFVSATPLPNGYNNHPTNGYRNDYKGSIVTQITDRDGYRATRVPIVHDDRWNDQVINKNCYRYNVNGHIHNGGIPSVDFNEQNSNSLLSNGNYRQNGHPGNGNLVYEGSTNGISSNGSVNNNGNYQHYTNGASVMANNVKNMNGKVNDLIAKLNNQKLQDDLYHHQEPQINVKLEKEEISTEL